jgi:hypothetical protein
VKIFAKARDALCRTSAIGISASYPKGRIRLEERRGVVGEKDYCEVRRKARRKPMLWYGKAKGEHCLPTSV